MYYLKFFIFGIVWTGFLVLMAFIKIPFSFLGGETPLVYFNEVSFKNLYLKGKDQYQEIINFNAIKKFPEKPKSVLDGETEIENFGEGEKVIAIMVENHPDSRTQMSGLNQAAIIYETEAEGGITRFMGVFNKFNIEKVGPVRSARPYFVDFAEEYQGGYAHAGGSDLALTQVHNGKIFNLEALFHESGGKYFYRDNNYYAPHNLFANLTLLPELINKGEWDKSITARFNFLSEEEKNAFLENKEKANYISVNFSRNNYLVEYYYDTENQKYLRYLAGKEHIDHLDNSNFTPSNILIQFTEYAPYDNYGRNKMRTSGEGKALLFMQGRVLEGKWVKTDITRFYDLEGKELKLSPGQTFIEIIKEGLVTWEDKTNSENLNKNSN